MFGVRKLVLHFRCKRDCSLRNEQTRWRRSSKSISGVFNSNLNAVECNRWQAGTLCMQCAFSNTMRCNNRHVIAHRRPHENNTRSLFASASDFVKAVLILFMKMRYFSCNFILNRRSHLTCLCEKEWLPSVRLMSLGSVGYCGAFFGC